MDKLQDGMGHLEQEYRTRLTVHATPPRTRLLSHGLYPPSLSSGESPEARGGQSTNVAKAAKAAKTWSNVRLVLSEAARIELSIPSPSSPSSVSQDAADSLDEGEQMYAIGRLNFTTSTHYSIRNNVLDNIELAEVSLPALGIQNLMNGRGPDALISSIPNEFVHSKRMMDMLLACYQKKCCLVSKTRDHVDIVLVPRMPSVASRDTVYWMVYATNLSAVSLCENLRLEKRVAVVLDLDQTLVDAEPCSWSGDVAELDSYSGMRWEDVEVRDWDGRVVRGKRGWPLDGFDDTHGVDGVDDVRGEDVLGEGHTFFIQYSRYLFRVRVRRGWWELRRFLIENKSRYMTFVCSKGKREYVELIYGGLDVDAQLIQREKWPQRITSTWPDTLAIAADKTAMMALGCAGPGDWIAVETHIAAPLICVDDCPQTYSELFRPNVLLVEKFSNGMSAGGFAMLRVIEDLHTFWEGVCGKEGTFAWRAAQSFGMAIMDAVRRTPMDGPDSLEYLQVRCRKQGELLYRQLTVEYVLPGSTPASNEISTRRRLHAPKSAGSLDRSRTSLEMNNREALNESVLNALGPRRSLDEAFWASPERRVLTTSSASIAVPKMIRNESGIRNNSYGSTPRGSSQSLSPRGLSPGSIDDWVTYSLRFKN